MNDKSSIFSLFLKTLVEESSDLIFWIEEVAGKVGYFQRWRLTLDWAIVEDSFDNHWKTLTQNVFFLQLKEQEQII